MLRNNARQRRVQGVLGIGGAIRRGVSMVVGQCERVYVEEPGLWDE